jgi:hypothetical protein
MAQQQQQLRARVGAIGPITQMLGVGDARLGATLVGPQIVVPALMRYVTCLEPLASASIDALVAAAIGPAVQRHLTGEIGSRQTQSSISCTRIVTLAR